MDASTWGFIGGVVGTLCGLGGAAFGCWVTYRVRGRTPAQRTFLKRQFIGLFAASIVLVALAWMASLRQLSPSTYLAALIVWMTGIIAFSIWSSLRLEKLGPPPVVFGAERHGGVQLLTADQRRYLVRNMACMALATLAFLAAIFVVATKPWPVRTLWLIVPLYVAGILGIVWHALRRFRVPDQMRVALRMMRRAM